ncbi:unnamed protein product [Darwinula stevensoni]|uniref:Uncharacterized protein n=1 Tax=Darwinula stevensoni TaxID=69355 RepID=A0A7R8XBU1_9CRUS|nr:unnamed protein product [Darwinula stevensoni]CAG0893122.1 unnamed protein product [Darwinula stevensoni]
MASADIAQTTQSGDITPKAEREIRKKKMSEPLYDLSHGSATNGDHTPYGSMDGERKTWPEDQSPCESSVAHVFSHVMRCASIEGRFEEVGDVSCVAKARPGYRRGKYVDSQDPPSTVRVKGFVSIPEELSLIWQENETQVSSKFPPART